MFPKEDYLYKTAPKIGFIIGITEILLSGFIFKGYINASKKVLHVYQEFNLTSSSGFTWGYVSIAMLLVLGILSILFGFLVRKSKPETKARYYNFLIFLLFLGVVVSFVCVYMFTKCIQ